MRILLGITGGVAAFKAVTILRLLRDNGHQVRVIVTENALRFVGETTLANLSGNKVNKDLYEDTEEGAHIELADWAQKVLIAPATASTIGRLANGIATDLLSNVVLATSADVVIAPAMHTNMFNNPATQSNLKRLTDQGVQVIWPAVGRLSGKDSGIGRLPEPEEIVPAFLGEQPLKGLSACVTLGGTQESIDTVRYIGNHSSGKQGLAFANALRDAGAEVKIIAANVDVETEGFEFATVRTYQQLSDELSAVSCDLLVMAAAVSDFTVVQSKTKLKSGDSIELKLAPTEDLIKNFRRSKPSTKILAFSVADRDSDWVEIAKLKKLEKEVDFIFANTTDAFSSDESHGVLISEEAHELSGSKSEIAQGAVQLIQGSLLK